MPYLIITDKQHELDRHELTGPVVIGRSPDCDVVVRDVLLSRRHCRIEPQGNGWMVVDLGSKNGTYNDTTRIEQQALSDADVIRAGPRTRVIFRAGKFIPPPPEVIERKAARRPADPIEALSGTMVGVVLTDMEENSRVTGFPIPKPKKVEAAARQQAVEHDMKKPATAIASYYDLELREATPPKSRVVESIDPAPEVVARQKKIRASREHDSVAYALNVRRPVRATREPIPRQFATSPRWLAAIYVLLAYALCALALWLLSWR